MTAKLFRTSLAMALAVMVLSIGLFMGMLYQYFSDQLMEELENETRLVSQGVELEGMAYLDGLRSVNRVTWVAADGTVLFDNEADPAEMENHADREEIREAMDSETGTAQRYSSTLSEQTLYVTRRLDDGSVIRLASAQKTVGLLLISMVQPILVILVLSLLLAAVLSSRLAKGIIRPILALDLEHPEDCETYEELTPLLSRLKRQNDTIQQQMDLLRQRQTEFAALTDNMSEGFLLLDRQGHVLSHNSGALRLLGAEEPEGEVNALVLNRDEPFRQAVDEVLSGRRSRQLLHLNGRYCRLLANPVPLCGVLGDSHAALLGQDCRMPGQTKATYGTGSSVMMQTGDQPVQSQYGLVTSLAWGLGGKVEYVLEGNLNYTGAVITWLKKNAGLLTSDGESESLARMANPADRTYFVPAFTGLGAPYWDSDATGLLTGITRTTGRAEIVKACVECIAYQITDLLERMAQDAGLPLTELRVDGGPTANHYLMQFQSDLAQVTVSVPEIQELSGFGAACAAGFSCGFYQPAMVHDQLNRRSYHPQMNPEEREIRYAGWQKAVRQTLTRDNGF